MDTEESVSYKPPINTTLYIAVRRFFKKEMPIPRDNDFPGDWHRDNISRAGDSATPEKEVKESILWKQWAELNEGKTRI